MCSESCWLRLGLAQFLVWLPQTALQLCDGPHLPRNINTIRKTIEKVFYNSILQYIL